MLCSSVASATVRGASLARRSPVRIAPAAALLPGSGRSPARKDNVNLNSRKISSGVSVNASGFDAFISKLIPKGDGSRAPDAADRTDLPAPAPGVVCAPGMKCAQFAGGCFWGVELAYQRIPGVTKTAVGYTQGKDVNPSYEAVCSGKTGHTEAVLVEYDPAVCKYETLVELLWTRIDPTQVNGQGNDWGTQYRTGIYYHDEEQREIAVASRKREEEKIGRTIATEILPATQWYNAEKYHQQYLAKGGRNGRGQSAEKGCKDPIRCYG